MNISLRRNKLPSGKRVRLFKTLGLKLSGFRTRDLNLFVTFDYNTAGMLENYEVDSEGKKVFWLPHMCNWNPLACLFSGNTSFVCDGEIDCTFMFSCPLCGHFEPSAPGNTIRCRGKE